MNEKKESSKSTKNDDDVETMLDTLWDNLSSRRKCEHTHTPEYVKKKQLKKN